MQTATAAPTLDLDAPNHRAARRALALALAEARSVGEVLAVHGRADALAALARRSRNATLLAGALEYRYRAIRHLGRLMEQQRLTVGLTRGGRPYQATGSHLNPVGRPPTLAEAGVDKYLADQARRAAQLTEEVFEARITGLWRDAAKGSLCSLRKNLMWAPDRVPKELSPPEVLAAARAAMGGIDLDPCSCAAADLRVGARAFLSPEDGRDGLAEPWHGRVWMNPPYLPGALLRRFGLKLAEEYTAGRVSHACTLVPSHFSDADWFQCLTQLAGAVCLFRGKTRFYDRHGRSAVAPRGSAVHYLGPDPARFASAFDGFGVVLTAWPKGRS